MTIRLRGLDQIESRLRKIAQSAPRAASIALDPEGRSVLEEAKLAAPIDKGDLRASGYARPRVNARGAQVEVGFTAEYALLQHEMHKTKSKFLSRSLNAAAGGMLERLGGRLRPWLARGGN